MFCVEPEIILFIIIERGTIPWGPRTSRYSQLPRGYNGTKTDKIKLIYIYSFKFLQLEYWAFSIRKYIELNFPQLFRNFTFCFILFFLLSVINFFWCQEECWRRIDNFELTAFYWSPFLFLNFYLSKGKKKHRKWVKKGKSWFFFTGPFFLSKV